MFRNLKNFNEIVHINWIKNKMIMFFFSAGKQVFSVVHFPSNHLVEQIISSNKKD